MMRPRLVLASMAACVGFTFLASWLFQLKLERAAVLSPVIVACFGAAAAVLVLWTRVALESLRKSAHPRRVVAIWVGIAALIALLTALGVELPKE